MNPAVGIDLGTTNTVVAIQTDDTGPRVLEIPQPVHERHMREPLDSVKSAVFFESKEAVVVGAFAANRLEALRSVKSQMGTRWRMPHPHNRRLMLTPAYVSGHILKLLFDELSRQFPQWDSSALVTVPASFNTDQRSDTLLAARLAGFQSVQLLDEPIAAYYFFFDQNRDSIQLDRRRHTALVFDFGGGTLDVSIIRVQQDGDLVSIDAIGRSRYNNLGGDDIDTDLAVFLLALYEGELGSQIVDLEIETRKKLYQLFQQKASAFKEEAEHYISAGIPLNEFVIEADVGTSPGSLQRLHFRRQLTRAQYEEISGRYFQTNSDLNIFRPIGQALEVAVSIDPEFRQDQIDLVLYTGGASRMTAVRPALMAYFGTTACYAISDEEACSTVALGAACCQYDKIQRHRRVRMTARLLESVMTRDYEGLRYVTIVPLECVPSEQFRTVDHQFKTSRPTVTLRLPLFRGVNSADHHLSPMQDVELKLPHVLDTGVDYSLEYRMTPDKTIQLRATFRPPSEAAITLEAKVDIESAVHQSSVLKTPLSQVN